MPASSSWSPYGYGYGQPPPRSPLTPILLLGGGGLVLAGTVLILRKRATAPRVGDTLGLSSLSFRYRGPAQDLWVGWGAAKSGFVPGTPAPYDDGRGLIGGQWASGGTFRVAASTELLFYQFEPERFTKKPRLQLFPGLFEQGKVYDCFLWVATRSSLLELDHVGRSVSALKFTLL